MMKSRCMGQAVPGPGAARRQKAEVLQEEGLPGGAAATGGAAMAAHRPGLLPEEVREEGHPPAVRLQEAGAAIMGGPAMEPAMGRGTKRRGMITGVLRWGVFF